MNTSTFINKLVDRLKEEKTFELILQDVEENKITWDKAARNKIGPVVKSVFQEMFSGENIKEAVNIEGEGALINPYKLFGSLGQWPDIRILRPSRIAIELDNAGRGEPGSRFKTALAKAAFGYLSGDWDYCIILFHNHTGRSMKPFLEEEKEKEILKIYRGQFNTEIFLFE